MSAIVDLVMLLWLLGRLSWVAGDKLAARRHDPEKFEVPHWPPWAKQS